MSQAPGLIVGWHKKLGYLVFRGQQFVSLIAPTRSGKGVGFVIPNLLTYPDSMIVLDVKLENYKYTSKFRAEHGQEVYLFAPFSEDGRTHRWNMFDAVRKRPQHLWFGDLLTLAESYYPSDVDPKTKFFNDSSRNLFVGLALLLLETPSLPCTPAEIFRQGSGYGKPIKTHIKEMIDKRNGDNQQRPLSAECLDALNRFLQIPDITLGNVLATFNAPLLIFADPIVDAATSVSDFDLGEVRSKRMTIYFGVQPDRLQGGDAGLLINLFYSQALILNMRELPQNNPALKYQCTLLNDEIPAVGRLAVIAKSNAYIAGYNMRLATIAQSQSQLEDEKLYGKHGAKTLLTNHALQMMYPPREQSEAEEYSKMLGTYTMKARGRSRSRGKGSSTSINESDQKRPLMMPQELREMKKNQMIISLENTKPIQCEKAYFYADTLFTDRLKALSPYLAAVETKLPTQKQLEHAAFVLCELQSDVPTLDLAALYAAAQKPRTAPVALRPVKTGDLAALKVSDIANYEQMKESLFKLLPGFANVQKAMSAVSSANAAAVAS
ncbi:type IV secretory system conjugative DNA transfer family protein [Paraburkholderia largidicola]|uniref:Protein VirD4 n=1 Tax=Paraburkholderia largidicola TaxID=3014751 RepID=A0A7I8C4N3_9BURK|nr:type IV secretory system conjugative DNA transfer family protein [Paraburkholderia sp. PGU16]BCF95421.1 protein VirD4 [Paraburkholderia sp. PGU16]